MDLNQKIFMGSKMSCKKGEVILHLLDLSDSEKVHIFAKNFDQELYCLVNNAGCMVNDRQVTSAGFEVRNFLLDY